jgi:hypothetical protein
MVGTEDVTELSLVIGGTGGGRSGDEGRGLVWWFLWFIPS